MRELLRYDPGNGLFQWVKPRGRAPKDWFAGSEHGSGYLVICVDGVSHRAHRLAWLYVKGKWPRFTIDHRNREKRDNRFANLRDVAIRRNSLNREYRPRREGSAVGVERRVTKSGVKWRVRLGHYGRMITVGTFHTQAEAEAAYLEAKHLMHPGATVISPTNLPSSRIVQSAPSLSA